MIPPAKIAKVLLTGCCLAGLFWSARGTAQDVRVLPFDYYPLKVGNKWTYKSGDHKVIERVDKIVVLEIKKADKTEVEQIPAHRVVTTHKDRELAEFIAVLPEGVFRYAGDDKEVTPKLCIFKLPLKTGDSWPCSMTVAGSVVNGTFTAKKEDVTVPLRKFEGAILISGEFQVGGKKMTVETWYAANTGIVKKRVKLGNDTTELELENFEEGK